VEEPIPHNAPKAIGKVVNLCMFVDSDHEGDHLVFKETVYAGDSHYCLRICCHEDRCRNSALHMI
ncbi:hypothetical protein ACHAXS_004857, partial [Conticribra weissflogii]